MNLNEIWESLEAEPKPDGPRLRLRSALDRIHSSVAAGLRHPGPQRVLVLRLDAPQARTLLKRGMTPAINLTRLADDPLFPGQVNIELASAERRHQELFALIGEDLAAQLEADPPDAGRVILDRLELWHEFLRRREEGDAERWARGLFGELWYLRDQVLPRRPGMAGLACWLGPAGATHDFEAGAFAIDLKTGTAGDEIVHISSLQQLSPPPGSQLFLGHLRLRRDGQGSSLRELVAGIRAELALDAQPLFKARLLAAGYLDQDAHLHDPLRLAVQDLRIFHIKPAFPALTRRTVPAGIEQCTYTVNLATCHSFQVPAGFPWITTQEASSSNEQ